MTEPSAPDYIGRVAGVRIWRVAPNLLAQHMGLLWGPGAREPWPTGKECEATCVRGHNPPEDDCLCGLWAFYTPELAIGGSYWPDAYPAPKLYDRLVAGVIGAGGDILAHDYGFRAERATVEALFDVGAPDDALPLPREILADAYGVPVITPREYEGFCEEAGLILVTDPDAI